MPTNSKAFPNQLDRDIVKRHFDEYVDHPAEYTMLAKIDSKMVGKGKGDHVTESFLSPLGSFNLTNEGQGVTYDSPVEGDKKTSYFQKWTLGFQITEEAIDDSLDNNFDVLPTKLAKSAKYKQDASWFDLLNRGFATHKTADGQYLFHATGHTTLKGLNTQATRPSSDASLSATSLQAAFEAFDGFKDEAGNPIRIAPRFLVVPKELQWMAQKLAKTDRIVGSADNDINTVAPANIYGGSGWSVFKSLWLTSSTAWFLIAGPEDHDLRFMWRWPYRFQSSDDFNTGSRLYKGVMRFKCDVWDYRGVYGTSGA